MTDLDPTEARLQDLGRALQDLLAWDHGGSATLRARHRCDAGRCVHCGGEWPCPPYVALDALDAYGRHAWTTAQQTEETAPPAADLTGALLALTATFTDRMGDYVRSSWWRSDELAVITELVGAS